MRLGHLHWEAVAQALSLLAHIHRGGKMWLLHGSWQGFGEKTESGPVQWLVLGQEKGVVMILLLQISSFCFSPFVKPSRGTVFMHPPEFPL